MTEPMLVRVHASELAPDYQVGDHVSVLKADSAEAGDVVVVEREVDGVNVLTRWPAEGAVVGRVLEMYRRVN